jgi:hypothetical protein
MIQRFTDRDVFRYKDIIKVEFSPGFTDWKYLIVLSIFGSGGFGGHSKADQVIINTIDNKTLIYNRFGRKTSFIKTIELINKKIKPCN